MSKVGSARPNGNQAGRVLRWRLLRTRRPDVDIISGASLDQKNKCIPGRSSILMPQEDTGLRRACTSHDLLSRRLSLLKPGSPIGESDRSRPCCPGLALATFSLPLGTHPSLDTRDAVAARAPNAPSWKQCRPEPINGLARRRRRECLSQRQRDLWQLQTTRLALFDQRPRRGLWRGLFRRKWHYARAYRRHQTVTCGSQHGDDLMNFNDYRAPT